MPLLRPLTLVLALVCICGTTASAAQNVPLDAYLRGGRIHYQGGRFERAKEQFSHALTAYGGQVDNVRLAEIYLWLGLSEAQLRENNAAAMHLHLALESDSTAALTLRQDEQKMYWAWTALIAAARQSYASGNYDSSLTYALAATQVDPGKPGSYALVANSYNAMGRYEDMLATAHRILKLDTLSPDGLSLIGLYFLEKPDSLWPAEQKLSRWDSCAHYYKRAIDVYESRFVTARRSLGEKLKIADSVRLDQVAWTLVEKSRLGNQEDLKNYIEKTLGVAKQLADVAQITSQLFYAANNLNVSSSRAGSAMLRASSENKGENAARFRSAAESLFTKALSYDPSDYTAMFNLGIAQYQSQRDSLAQSTFQRVIDGAVVPLTVLPDNWQTNVLNRITADVVKQGWLALDPATTSSIDSILATRGYLAAGYGWLYFPELRNRQQPLPAGPSDAFISLESPKALENIYLLLGVTETGMALSLQEAKKKEEARLRFEKAISSLLMVTSLNPNNAEAYQNLVHCYRETDQKQKAEQAYKKFKELSK